MLTDKDIVFIPGLDPEILFEAKFLRDCLPLFYWLRRQLASGTTICSVCTGAFLLAEAGILRQRECTTHWDYLERFSQQFPEARLLGNRLFVRDGTIYTSAGVTSGIDLALHMIEDLIGARVAADIARDLVVYLRRSSDAPQLSVFLRYRNHLDENIHTAQDYLAQHLSGDCHLSTIAGHVNMSPRNLSRRFRQRTGLSVGAYLELIRVEKANQLLARGEQVTVVASAIGVEVLDFAGPLEVLTYAGFKVFTVSKTKDPIISQGVLKILPDYGLENAPPTDIIAVFGGNGLNTSQDTAVTNWIKNQQQAQIHFSVCTGALILAEAGILDGTTATTFHNTLDHLEETYPKVKVLRNVRYVDNGNVISTAGISAGIDGALHLVVCQY